MENFPNYAGYGQSPTVCVNHPDRVSYAQCKRCSRTVCGECQVALDVANAVGVVDADGRGLPVACVVGKVLH